MIMECINKKNKKVLIGYDDDHHHHDHHQEELSRIGVLSGGGKECSTRRSLSAPPSLSIILEPTPIDPTRIVTVLKVPYDSSSPPLGKLELLVDETVLSALCDVLKNKSSTRRTSSTPIPGISPNMTSLLLEVESVGGNHDTAEEQEQVDHHVLSEKSHDCIAMWSGAGLQRLQTNNKNMAFFDDGDHNQDASRKSPCSTWGGGVVLLHQEVNPTMRHSLSTCYSPESSSSSTNLAQNNKSSTTTPRSEVASSDKVKLLFAPMMIGDHHGSCNSAPTTTFRIHQTEQWHQRYLDLLQFSKKYGNCLVPLKWPSNPSLAHWVKRQRHQYRAKQEHKHSTLTDERQRLLEQLGFVWDSHASVWEEHLEELQDFKETHGHCRVPKAYASNPQLAIWVKCQRRQFKLYSEGKDSNMTIERIHKLRKLGFAFSPRKPKESL